MNKMKCAVMMQLLNQVKTVLLSNNDRKASDQLNESFDSGIYKEMMLKIDGYCILRLENNIKSYALECQVENHVFTLHCTPRKVAILDSKKEKISEDRPFYKRSLQYMNTIIYKLQAIINIAPLSETLVGMVREIIDDDVFMASYGIEFGENIFVQESFHVSEVHEEKLSIMLVLENEEHSNKADTIVSSIRFKVESAVKRITDKHITLQLVDNNFQPIKEEYMNA